MATALIDVNSFVDQPRSQMHGVLAERGVNAMCGSGEGEGVRKGRDRHQ